MNLGYHVKQYLPLVDLKSETTILATTSRTKITQTFHNPQLTEKLDEVQYTFPLYDGVSVVSFKCTVAGRTILGVVKEKQQARTDYQAAVDRGETAGLFEQIPEASDAFTTKLGNIPANEDVIVEIEYLGELKHDAETDGSRFTIPTVIAPRYGSASAGSYSTARSHGISISVDVAVDDGSVIRGIQSPSHPIAVTMGRISTTIDEDAFDNHHASATLTLTSAVLEKDFVIVVLAKGQDTPRALLQTHPTIPNQRALMTTLVPKFNLPSIHPEIVFVVDRSGSMGGKIPTLIAALKVFLKSLPVSVKFNICSFGTHNKFMFKKSKAYNQSSLQEALDHVNGFAADFGGTEMYPAIEATFKNRLSGLPLEVLVLTDGQIWDQERLFTYINEFSAKHPVRVFSLGIGSGASSSLVEGIARAGDGFAQFVDDNEKMDKRVVRMLKGALSPHINNYKLEVKYAKPSDDLQDDYEIIESVETGISKLVIDEPKAPLPKKKVISLFDTSSKETPTNPVVGRYDHLPRINPPAILQAPHNVPTLYPFNRTTVYLLLGPNACQQTPSSVVLRATSEHGPLELEIPVQDIGIGQTIHQLAAKKAVQEVEQGRGWLSASNFKQKLVGTQHESRMDEIIEREAVRLGVEFQVGGKFCSFVAVEDGVDHVPAPGRESAEVEDGRPNSNRSARKSMMLQGAPSFGGSSQRVALSASSAPGRGRHDVSSMSLRRAVPAGASLFGGSVEAKKKGGAPSPAYAQYDSFQASSNQPDGAVSYSADPANIALAMGPTRARIAQPPAEMQAQQSSFFFSHRNISGEALVSPRLMSTSPRLSSRDADRGGSYGSAQAAPMSNEDKVRALIDLNQFDGSWMMSEKLGKIMGADWDAVKKWTRAGWSETARATALVIAFLEVKIAKEQDIWEMVVEKARDWLAASVNDAEDGIDEVKKLL